MQTTEPCYWWFDWLIIILEGDKLATDELHFKFQVKSSTSMCVYLGDKHCNKSCRPIFACSMDLSKAFDMVSWAKLFPELLERKISPLILKGLVHIYSYQMCNVRWGGILFYNLWMEKWCTPGCSILAYIVLCLYKGSHCSTLKSESWLSTKLPIPRNLGLSGWHYIIISESIWTTVND